jgi:hypothetical protein
VDFALSSKPLPLPLSIGARCQVQIPQAKNLLFSSGWTKSRLTVPDHRSTACQNIDSGRASELSPALTESRVAWFVIGDIRPSRSVRQPWPFKCFTRSWFPNEERMFVEKEKLTNGNDFSDTTNQSRSHPAG